MTGLIHNTRTDRVEGASFTVSFFNAATNGVVELVEGYDFSSSSSSSSSLSSQSSQSSNSSISSSSDSSLSSESSGLYPEVYFKFNESASDVTWRSELGGYSLDPGSLWPEYEYWAPPQPFSSYVVTVKIGNAIRCKNGSVFWHGPANDDLFVNGFIPWVSKPTFAVSFWIQNLDIEMPSDNPRGIMAFQTAEQMPTNNMQVVIATGSGSLTGHKDLVFSFNTEATASNVLTLGGGWNFVVVNFNGSGVPITVYVDNVLVSLTGTTIPTSVFSPPLHSNGLASLYLGKYGVTCYGVTCDGWPCWASNSACTLSGDIDMFAVWNAPLSESAINKLWNGGVGLL